MERIGRHPLRYSGREVEATLSYRAATARLGEPWLMLEFAVTGKVNRAAEISRARVWLPTPTGATLPLPTQEESGRAFVSLRAKIARADVAADPLEIWSGPGEYALPFLVEPGTTTARLSA